MKKRLCSLILGLSMFGFSATHSFAKIWGKKEFNILLNTMLICARNSHYEDFERLDNIFKKNPNAQNRFPDFFWNNVCDAFQKRCTTIEVGSYSYLSDVFHQLMAKMKYKNIVDKNQIGPAFFTNIVCNSSIIGLKYDKKEIIKPIILTDKERQNITRQFILTDKERQNIAQQLQAIIGNQ